MHSTFLGSGSHSPLSMHANVWGPLKICPGEQYKVTVVPSTAGSVYPITFMPELVVWLIGFPQRTVIHLTYCTGCNIRSILTVVQSSEAIYNVLSTRRGSYNINIVEGIVGQI